MEKEVGYNKRFSLFTVDKVDLNPGFAELWYALPLQTV